MAIDTSTIPNLGNIIENPAVRKGLWAAYTVAAIALGATQVWFAATTGSTPDWVNGGLQVIGYLAIPFGGLALANVPTNATSPEIKVEGENVVVEEKPADDGAVGL